MLTDSAARWLLVLHTALGVAAVGASTHLLLWLWRRKPRALRFAWLVVALMAAAFVAGNAMYPTYKVEVRAAYLESPGAVTAAAAAHQHDIERVAAREGARPAEATPSMDIVRRAAQAARWFDVKETWVALGLLCAAALAWLLSIREAAESSSIRPVLLGLAAIVAGSTWLAAVVGVVVASYRAV
ncbi:MAG: hypothetical protein JO257_31200 [Deltaproteobacteria bacterium]|nr:hypothetical protein [Deltaproteobacteria bacterium]